MTEQKKLLAKGSLIEVHAWKGLLATKGIEAELKGEALLGAAGEFGYDASLAEVWVDDSQLQAAESLLKESQRTGTPWFCRECGEQNEANFELCWQCGNEAEESK